MRLKSEQSILHTWSQEQDRFRNKTRVLNMQSQGNNLTLFITLQKLRQRKGGNIQKKLRHISQK